MLKRWLRVRAEIGRYLSSRGRPCALGEMERAIAMARSQLVGEKGRERYVREMVGGALGRLPPSGEIEVIFEGDTVKLSGGQDLVQQILRLEAAKGSWATSLIVGDKQLFL